MRLSDLQRKDIIDVVTGKRMGRIIDVDINEKDGTLISLIIEKGKYLKSMFNSDEDDYIKFENIKKMGEDVILVEKSIE
ncbi:MAG: YlmC/YmxH family sporulation protein [Bacilli bacterium]|nr:YlmC/YmxH family sporulation protein [Bacilli bacterium]